MDTQDCTYSTSLLVPHIRTLKSEPPSKAKKIPLKIMAEFDNSNFTHYYYSETFYYRNNSSFEGTCDTHFLQHI